MSVWFTSDLHFGHKNIQKFRTFVSSEENNRKLIMDFWKKNVSKRDDVYVLGDACFTMETVEDFSSLPGRKFLIRGNHDKLDTQVYLKYFHSVEGLLKYKEFWLSHAPIHPEELRGKTNLHGHTHYHNISDLRYFNCCVENLMNIFKTPLVRIEKLRELIYSRYKSK